MSLAPPWWYTATSWNIPVTNALHKFLITCVWVESKRTRCNWWPQKAINNRYCWWSFDGVFSNYLEFRYAGTAIVGDCASNNSAWRVFEAFYIGLTAWLFTLDQLLAMLVFRQQRYCSLSSIHPLTQVTQKRLHLSRPNFMRSYLSTNAQTFFFNFSIFKFLRVLFVFVNMGPYGS